MIGNWDFFLLGHSASVCCDEASVRSGLFFNSSQMNFMLSVFLFFPPDFYRFYGFTHLSVKRFCDLDSLNSRGAVYDPTKTARICPKLFNNVLTAKHPLLRQQLESHTLISDYQY